VPEFKPIRCLAIVNRGEAAMRCIRAVKSLRTLEGSDMRVAALYTAVDRGAPFVRHADLAHELPLKTTAVGAYLDHDGLIAALKRIRADAVWPGWGFVAESPTFVDRLNAEGIRFLGPSGDTMRELGDKIASKLLAERAKVPVTAWSSGVVADVAEAERHAKAIGYPLVIKASAGGGGRGIRLVHEASQLAGAFTSAQSEAITAFGDGRLFMESMVRGGRHIEVQIIADQHQHVVAVGTRDCSVQRRHQKVLEEAPPVGLSKELLDQVKSAAVSLAASVGYVGAGTVEFLVRDPEFFFLEMNPRLQVEHGITEEITGTDLVQLQIRVARGEVLPRLAFEEKGFALEARVCAEDPDAGFLPAPGRLSCFDPALGPRVRVDTGVVVGTRVPPDFDSLIAKIIAVGDTREEARARLECALRDFDLVIEGGATNKGYLLEVLRAKEYVAGGVDTGWLDRWNEHRESQRPLANEALVLAAILSYQQAAREARSAFFADPGVVTPERIPRSNGRQIDLNYSGEQYRLRVFSIGSWRYRVHMEGAVVSARLSDPEGATARIVVGGKYLRAVHDLTESTVRVEVEGVVHQFGRQMAGQVRAGAPSLVVSILVAPGDRVKSGQAIGLLEAMKMEIGFTAPVAGTVAEVRVKKGQQVGAGEVMLVIKPEGASEEESAPKVRLSLPTERDPLSPLFTLSPEGALLDPDLARAETVEPFLRDLAMASVNEEIGRIVLGYDIYAGRLERLLAFLRAPLPEGLSESLRADLARVRLQLTMFADVEELHSRARRTSEQGEVTVSNHLLLRGYVRNIDNEAKAAPQAFRDLLRNALAHYGVRGLGYTDSLERAVLRLFASRVDSEPRHRLIAAVLRRVQSLTESGLDLSGDTSLRDALRRIGAMRGLVSDEVADLAVDVFYSIFDRPEALALVERTTQRVEQWLADSHAGQASPPETVLADLALAPPRVFDRVAPWLAGADSGRRVIALAAYIRRLYAPEQPESHMYERSLGRWIDRVRLPGGRVVVGTLAENGDLATALAALNAMSDASEMLAFEILLVVSDVDQAARHRENLLAQLGGKLLPKRITLTLLGGEQPAVHETYTREADGSIAYQLLHGIHPEAAVRIDFHRYSSFALKRIVAPEGVYCFHAKSIEQPDDERLFVLSDMRSRPRDDGNDASLFLPLFESAFHEATRTLRSNISTLDPRRRMQWNRIVIFMAHEITLDASIVEQMSRRLFTSTRHLGLEKVVVRVKLLDRRNPADGARNMEIVIADTARSRMQIEWREAHHAPLVPASAYERKVVASRRRGLVYPYEMIRMLTRDARNRNIDEVVIDSARGIPLGSFEEFDLVDGGTRAVSVHGRGPGKNTCAIVIGIMRTPTDKVPEGMARVVVLSDPTMGMGSLAAAECDRVHAAIDLAEELKLPLEWVAVSSGAKIAMDSGTENLDAVARVVRRIVTFTQDGGFINMIIAGVNVGGQSYWNALSTMLMHCKGALIMLPQASMVLTGANALAASGSVSAEDEVSIAGHERIMGPNGQAQYFAEDLGAAYRLLYDFYRYTYVVPGEKRPRRLEGGDLASRDVCGSPYVAEGNGFHSVGEIFDQTTNPGRKRPFAMRALMRAVVDESGGYLERWQTQAHAGTAIVWDAHLGGFPVCMIGIESQNVARFGYRPSDGPAEWNGGTLFPQSSKKVARAINAASGNRPVVLLANLSGFDGSPESMRKLQLEYGAEIARACVNFDGPIAFLVVSRYHGGAYVVFSQSLNPNLRAMAVEGSHASVIGGGPAATVVFPREVEARVAADPRVKEARARLRPTATAAERGAFETLRRDVLLEKRAELAAEFDKIHSVERARDVGSLTEIIPASKIRSHLIEVLRVALSS